MSDTEQLMKYTNLNIRRNMLTMILAFINAKYDAEYTALFIGTFLIDLAIIEIVSTVVIGT